jgi:chromosomal replication initiation ATPase DnaA
MSLKGSLSGLDQNFVLKYFSNNRRRAVELYRQFMAGREDEATEQFYSSKKQGSILGDLDFVEQVKEKYILRNRYHDREVREIRRICGEKVIKKIRKEVCRVFKVGDGDLSQGKRGTSNIARQTALSLSRELSGLKLSEICDYYGIGCRQTVGAHFARLQVRMKKDKAFERKYNRLKLKCSQVAI